VGSSGRCNAVRFRPWPPQVFKDLARFLCRESAFLESIWSPNLLFTRRLLPVCWHHGTNRVGRLCGLSIYLWSLEVGKRHLQDSGDQEAVYSWMRRIRTLRIPFAEARPQRTGDPLREHGKRSVAGLGRRLLDGHPVSVRNDDNLHVLGQANDSLHGITRQGGKGGPSSGSCDKDLSDLITTCEINYSGSNVLTF
jgi:hypothetical protein